MPLSGDPWQYDTPNICRDHGPAGYGRKTRNSFRLVDTMTRASVSRWLKLGGGAGAGSGCLVREVGWADGRDIQCPRSSEIVGR